LKVSLFPKQTHIFCSLLKSIASHEKTNKPTNKESEKSNEENEEKELSSVNVEPALARGCEFQRSIGHTCTRRIYIVKRENKRKDTKTRNIEIKQKNLASACE